MINAIRMIRSAAKGESGMVPTCLLFSSDPASDAALLMNFVLTMECRPGSGQILVSVHLIDPDLVLGQVALSVSEAADYAKLNQTYGGIHLLLVGESSDSSKSSPLIIRPYYADWLGVIRQDAEISSERQITGLGLYRARRFRETGHPDLAVQALIAEVRLTTRPDGDLGRHAAYALHEAALLADRMGEKNAWEYFETVALMIYPNCHDALLGLALRAQEDAELVLRLLGRAYRIRSKETDLQVYVRTFARLVGQSSRTLRDGITIWAARADLGAPIFTEPGGHPLKVSPEDVMAHLRVLASRAV